MKLDQEKFWAGTQQSFWAAVDAQERAIEYMAGSNPVPLARLKDYIDELAGPIMEVHGNVGVVNIKGSLINGSAGYMRLYGALGYDDIREGITEAIAEKNVKAILLHVDSGGGQVAGCQELANYIMAAAKEKPMVAFTDTTACSAAYWLAAAADEVQASPTAMLGSIGVLIIHQEVSKMMAEAGITTNIIRSGKYKALVNRYEPLSDLAKEELQAQVDDLDEVFTGYVAERRKVSADTARKKMGQGREFLGSRALEVGLIDKLSTLTDAHASAESSVNNGKNGRKPVAAKGPAANNAANPTQGSTMKFNLSPEQLAALSAGASVASLQLTAEQLTGLQALAAAQAQGEEADEEATNTPPAAVTPPAAAQPAGVEFFRAELRDTQAALATASAQLTEANNKLAAQVAAGADLLKIARSSLGAMQVALGGTDTSEAVADTAVVAEYNKLSELFGKKFKAGRVTASTQQIEEPAKAAISPLFAQALAAK